MRKGCFCVLLLIMICGCIRVSYASVNDRYDLNIQTNGVNYNVNIKNIAEQNQINLDEYSYYIIKSSYGIVSICYSKSRITGRYISYSKEYRLYNGGEDIYKVELKEDGTNIVELWNLDEKEMSINKSDFIGANHDIFEGTGLIFARNHGYEYDISSEIEEEVNEIVKTKEETKVYEYPAINYNELTILPAGNVIKRIKKEVNEENGHVWDKVILSNGKEGYIFSDNLQIVEKYNNIEFQYKSQMYNVYFCPQELEIDLTEYPYYIIGKNIYGELSIYYSKSRITGKYIRYSREYRLYNEGEDVYKIVITEDRGNTVELWDLDEKDISMAEVGGYIAANHDVFCEGKLVFVRNHGYEYDISSEIEEEVNEIVKTKEETKVYEYPAINYNELVTLPAGNVIKRIKKVVNQVNGHTWDKIVLSNGNEGYVFSDSIEIEESYDNVEVQYDDKTVNVYFCPQDLEVNIEEYPYYMIRKNSYGGIGIYYSKNRITGKYISYSKEYRIYNGGEPIYKLEIEDNGIVTAELWNLNERELNVNKTGVVGTNHDIFEGTKLIFARDHGYEYDISSETSEEVNEIVKTKEETKVYEYPAINYNEIATLPAGNLIKRIKKAVNQVNGHTWDKIVLSNGNEGYVFSDSVEIEDNYNNLKFEYENKTYNVYFNPKAMEVNLEEYPYYFIGKNVYGDLSIYYSKDKITCEYHSYLKNYKLCNGGGIVYRISIGEDGTILEQLLDLDKEEIFVNNQEGGIGGNYDVYYGDTILFNASVYDEINKISFTTKGSWQDIKPDLAAYTVAKQGEEEYDSMPMIERVMIMDKLLISKSIFLGRIIYC